MTTAPHVDPFEEFNQRLTGDMEDYSSPLDDKEIDAFVEWLNSLPSAPDPQASA